MKCLKNFFFWLIFSIFSLVWIWNVVTASSLLDKAYDVENGKSNEYIIKKTWEEVLEWKNSMVVTVTETMLKFAFVIGLSMVVVWWIKMVLAIWDNSKANKARDFVVYVVVGIILAMSSLIIVNILQSVSKSFS